MNPPYAKGRYAARLLPAARRRRAPVLVAALVAVLALHVVRVRAAAARAPALAPASALGLLLP